MASGYLNRDLRPGRSWTWPHRAATSSSTTAPARSCSSPPASASRRCYPCCTSSRQSRSERDVWWLYGARRPQDDPFAAEAHTLLASLPHAREHVFYSAATPAERHRTHAARRASHRRQALASLGVPAGANAYVCGPASFMADMRDALTALGIDPAAIHTELFGALPSINPGLTGQTRRATPPAARTPGYRAAGHLRPQRHHHALRRRLAQRARSRRRLRRPYPVELPHRRLPHLRHAAAVRRHHLHPGPAGTPRRR